MRKHFLAVLSAAALSVSFRVPAPAALPDKTPPAPADAAAVHLNMRLDALLRSELFMTLGGVKPVSSTNPNAEAYKEIADAVASGKIRNPDILFFLDGDGPAMVSREAVARLLKDRTANEMLRRYSLPMPKDAETWVSTFTECNTGYFSHPFECDLLFGIGYGYPPLEVEAYAVDSASQRKAIISELASDRGLSALLEKARIPEPKDEAGWLRLQWQSTPGGAPGQPRSWQNAIYEIETRHKPSPRQTLRLPVEVKFEMPTYARFTNSELERDGYYLRSVYILTRNYDTLINSGWTPLELINDPGELKKDLPAFPEYLLSK